MLENRHLGRAMQLVAIHPFEFLAGGAFCVILTLLSAGLLFGPAAGGVLLMAIRRARNEPIQVTDVLRGFDNFPATFYVGLTVGALTLFGSLLLLLPGLLMATYFGLALPAVVDGEPSAEEAIRRGHQLASRAPLASAVFMATVAVAAFSGAVFLLVGLFATVPVALAAVGLAYEEMTRDGVAPSPVEG